MEDYFNATFYFSDWDTLTNITGAYPGLINALLTDEIEFAMGGHNQYLPKYQSVIHSTDIIEKIELTYLTINSELQTLTGSLLEPLDNYVWFSIAIFIALLLIIAIIFEKIIDLNENLPWLMINTFFQLGPSKVSKSIAGNILLQICWWFTFILMIIYGSLTISSMTIKNENIKDLDEFVELIIKRKLVPILGHQINYNLFFAVF